MSSILLIGTGRLAFHLGHALRRAGLPLAGVAGRDAGKAGALAAELGCPAFRISEALPPAGLRVIAVSDDAIGQVAAQLPHDGTPVIHLSGTKPLDLLGAHAHRGVLWPVQSFAPGAPIDLATVPLVLDADDDATLALLHQLAGRLSSTVVRLPFAQRQQLHLSAVLASNFPVFLLREAERLLVQQGIDPGLVRPLWNAATQRAPRDADAAVTGPARRGDAQTIAQHLRLLGTEPELRRAYAALSDLILHTYHPQRRDQQDL